MTRPGISRRRVLTILAGAAALPVLGSGAGAAVTQWRGIVLGAGARIILDHPDGDRLIALSLGEIRRLERIFSLHLPDSALSRLNRDGVLGDPPFELIELLSICAGLNERTKGAFDPTVQTLWALYAKGFASGKPPDRKAISGALQMTGWAHVKYSARGIAFDVPGMRLTFNGVAQGFIADKVTALLRRNGVRDVLVNTGEISALGKAPDGRSWQVRLGDAGGPGIPLNNAAVATSAPLGTTFDDNGRVGHILDPRTGLPGGIWSQISVVSGSAAIADGLSTGFCLLAEPEIETARGSDPVWLSQA